MTLLKLIFFLLLIVCLQVTTNDDNMEMFKNLKKRIIEKSFHIQNYIPDRGAVARPNFSLEALKLQHASVLIDIFMNTYEELQCSFVFIALMYMCVIKEHLSDSKKLEQLGQINLNDLAFTEEAKFMVNYSYTWNLKNWKCLTEVMWIFYMQAIWIVTFLKKYQDGVGESEIQYRLPAHVAVEKILEEYTESQQCKVYHQQTGLVKNIRYFDVIQDAINNRKTDIGRSLKHIKERFSKQLSANRFPEQGTQRFDLDRLRLHYQLADREIIHELITTFGVQLDSQRIANSLGECLLVVDDVVSLYEYIDCLATLQSQFVLLLKAIAVRIVIGYFMCLQQILSTVFSIESQYLNLVYHVKSYNGIMITWLTEFANYISRSNDQHLNVVIELLRQKRWSFSTSMLIDNHIHNLFQTLETMSSANGHFGLSDPIQMSEEFLIRWLVDVQKVIDEYKITYSKKIYKKIKSQVVDVLITIEIFVKYIKKITDGIGFDVVESFASLKESNSYRRLKQLETEY